MIKVDTFKKEVIDEFDERLREAKNFKVKMDRLLSKASRVIGDDVIEDNRYYLRQDIENIIESLSNIRKSL